MGIRGKREKMGKLDQVKDFQIVNLASQHTERVEDFLRDHIQQGDPVIETLLAQQDEAFEGSHLEMAIHLLANVCLRENVVRGIKPSALAAVGNNKILAVCFGTQGTFPHNLKAKPVKGALLDSSKGHPTPTKPTGSPRNARLISYP